MNGQTLGFFPWSQKLESFVSPKLSLWEQKVHDTSYKLNLKLFDCEHGRLKTAFYRKMPFDLLCLQVSEYRKHMLSISSQIKGKKSHNITDSSNDIFGRQMHKFSILAGIVHVWHI